MAFIFFQETHSLINWYYAITYSHTFKNNNVSCHVACVSYRFSYFFVHLLLTKRLPVLGLFFSVYLCVYFEGTGPLFPRLLRGRPLFRCFLKFIFLSTQHYPRAILPFCFAFVLIFFAPSFRRRCGANVVILTQIKAFVSQFMGDVLLEVNILYLARLQGNAHRSGEETYFLW